jgi:hypothetical protein
MQQYCKQSKHTAIKASNKSSNPSVPLLPPLLESQPRLFLCVCVCVCVCEGGGGGSKERGGESEGHPSRPQQKESPVSTLSPPPLLSLTYAQRLPQQGCGVTHKERAR